MKLSIIIVNYNVKHFLEQCLTSVYKAIPNICAEVFVVDNNSTDDSVQMVAKKFPQAKLIANKENTGFSKANNQAISVSKGEYVLLLNPDTVVEEDTFEKCISFMDAHPNGGGLGVKMIDGNGIFLPESKRGLPTPAVSFYKIFGLSNLFPKSIKFAKYHLGYLKENEINKIEVLSGAFMWMRKSVLDEIGYLDEAFFMYGEDIDLSYRIILAGYDNYYFPEAKIIHYKGESTKKGNINYVFIFYNAMIIFSKKHFAKKAKAFSFFINIAIYLRAAMAILFRFINYIKLPIIDAALVLLGLFFFNIVKPYLGFPNQLHLAINYQLLNVLSVIASVIIGIFITKGYKKPITIRKTLAGLIIGSILFYIVNLSFPTSNSFSFKYISAIVITLFVVIPSSRILLHYFNKLQLKKESKKKIILAGSENFKTKIGNISSNSNSSPLILNVKENNLMTENDTKNNLGKLNQLADLVEIYNVNEVVFSSSEITYHDIIEQMEKTKNKMVDFKITLNENIIIGGQIIDKI
jgi:GT2 family glycosyltransferase